MVKLDYSVFLVKPVCCVISFNPSYPSDVKRKPYSVVNQW